jgi:hypothetical protein
MKSELVEIFDESVPRQFLEDTIRCMYGAYREAHDYCLKEYEPSEMHDLLPHVRRAMVERNWRAVAARHPGVSASAWPNSTASSYHTRIRSGRVILTASAVERPGALTRSAEFRNTYARTSQLSFEDADHASPTGGESLYAILLHGPDPARIYGPGFVHVGFPAADSSGYVENIDLMARFRELVRAEATTQIETVESEPSVRLRRRSDVEGGQA